MQTKFIINHNDRELGPLTEAQIKKMLSGNQIFPTDYFYDEEKQDWIVISERFEVFAQPEVKAEERKVEKKEDKKEEKKPKMDLPVTDDTMKIEVMASEEIIISIPTPKPAANKASPTATAAHSGKIQLSGGMGTLNIQQVKAGQVSLKIKSKSGLELPTDLSLVIQAAPASQVKMEAPRQIRAGEECSIEFTALDDFENVAVDFKGTLEVQMIGQQKESRTAKFEKGIAVVKFKPTVAENVSIELKDSSKSNLKLPSAKMAVHPNIPVKLIAESPKEVRAGENFDLKITALDAFGNVVTDFKGEIDLEVESSVKKVG